MKAIPTTQARFDALCVIRAPSAQFFASEVEWWSIGGDRLIGTVLFDPSDDTWSFMILGRDTDSLFRGIHQGHNFESQAAASVAIQVELETLATKTQAVFPQNDVKRPGNITSLVTPVVAADKLHKHFQTLIELQEYSPAKELLSEFSPVFVDIDGNFVEQFQTTAFNARLWELYLDFMLREQGFTRITEFDRPDYCVMKAGFLIGIEAVTVNPSEKHVMPKADSPDEMRKVLEDFMPLRFSGPLNAKLAKRYWELPHMAGVPFMIAIQDFFTDQSMTWSLSALRRYLYGMHAEGFVHPDGTVDAKYEEVKMHVWGDKSLVSGFFNLPGSEHISAVMANASATLSKFNRIGKEAGLGDPKISMVRKGTKWDPDPKAAAPLEFKYEVTAALPRERWSDGVVIFVNPNAKNPLPLEHFEAGEILKIEAGRLTPYVMEGHVYASQTIISRVNSVKLNTRKAVIQALEELKKRYIALVYETNTQKRGSALEKVMYDLFRLFNLDPSASFQITGEQIDGAFTLQGQDYLFEAKWAGMIAAKEMDIFASKVQRKLDNTLGLMLSVDGFQAEGVEAHSKQRPVLLLMSGADLMAVFEGRIDFVDLLVRKRRHASQTGKILIEFSEM